MTLLREAVKQNSNYIKGQKVMFDICVTRWLEHLDGFSIFHATFPYWSPTIPEKTLNGEIEILNHK